MNRALKWLVPLIIILTLVATLSGVWPAQGTSYPLTNFRGEQVIINARGLYYWDTLSSVAQSQANDMVTLVLGLPLLAISFWLSLRGSLRGRLLLTGTLGFILYTYISMCFGTAYNQLFLAHIATPERFPAYMAPVFKVYLRLPMAHTYFDNMLKQNGVYEQRFDRPFA